ncbi:MAG: hypothetical protein KKE12_08595, partial [Proteobacteria bacterium]|nr:hypothetical protein [Pseudomonadota bacterium]
MENNAHYHLPAPDAVFVDPLEMPKFLRAKGATNRHGTKRKIQHGFLIRQSYIQDSRIVIPQGGLIYVESGAEYYGPLNSEPVSIAGKDAFWVDQQEVMIVKKNFFVPFKGRPVPLGEEGSIALSPSSFTDNYFGENAGSLRYVFANGHPGWDKWLVTGKTSLSKPQSLVANGYCKNEGIQIPPP